MRGVSPIVSTILMVAIAIAAAVVVYYVVMNVVSTQGAQLEQQASQGQEKIVIEEATLSSSGSLTAYVRNLSSTDVNISAAYVLDDSGAVVCSKTGINTTINANSVGTVSDTLTCTGTLSSGKTYTVKLVTAKGTPATKSVVVS